MDITYKMQEGTFNFRVAAVIIHNGKLLIMRDGPDMNYYLPGGRVRFGETVDEALMRESEEELHILPKIIRPLWLHQGFFVMDGTDRKYHELCLYYLIDASGTDLLERGETFTMAEDGWVHEFVWLPFERLKDAYFYPLFLKEKIFDLPDSLTIQAEYE